MRYSRIVIVALLLAFGPALVSASKKDARLDIYFIDVEGGACTLFVTPLGESLMIGVAVADSMSMRGEMTALSDMFAAMPPPRLIRRAWAWGPYSPSTNC